MALSEGANQHLRQLDRAIGDQKWARAKQLAQEILRSQPGEPDATALLRLAQRQLRAAEEGEAQGAPATSTNFVGRDRELHTMRGLMEKARNGFPQVVLLAGDSGVGKSRLARELAETEGRGGLVLLGTLRSRVPDPVLALGAGVSPA